MLVIEKKSFEYKVNWNKRKFNSFILKSKVRNTQVGNSLEVQKAGNIKPGTDGFNL
jgi:hypothetical protein